jgi:hypothetical protein
MVSGSSGQTQFISRVLKKWENSQLESLGAGTRSRGFNLLGLTKRHPHG